VLFEIQSATRPCPLTAGNDAILLSNKDRHGNSLNNICWRNSGLIGVDPIPIQNVEQFYRITYRQRYKQTVYPQKRHVLRAARCALNRFKRISPYLKQIATPELRTLDAGASSGEFVFLMQKLGHTASGIEANEGYATHAVKELGLDVANCTFSEFSGRPESFDLITLFHVLEHLEFPVSELQRLAGYLQSDGLMAIEVPNILYTKMKFSRKWHEAHLFGFSVETLETTAAMAGLTALSCGTIEDGGNLFGVFKKGHAISSEDASRRLDGHFEDAIQQLRHNSNLRYYAQSSTWLKIPRKLQVHFEEINTASSFPNSLTLLNAVYSHRSETPEGVIA
jgi:2-polyprenyl-3-methyl-5-hydroxy-6-metoxy-1,4-benzoquinol methylase